MDVLLGLGVTSLTVGAGLWGVVALRKLDVIPGAEFDGLTVDAQTQISGAGRSNVVPVGLGEDPDVVRVFSAPPGLTEITVRAPKSKAKATGCVEVTGQRADGKTVDIGTYVGQRSESWAPVSGAKACTPDNGPTVSRSFDR